MRPQRRLSPSSRCDLAASLPLGTRLGVEGLYASTVDDANADEPALRLFECG
jgi:hypothetical protein